MAKKRILSGARRPPVLVGCGFALVAAAIVGNALFLQSSRHPAPLFVPEISGASEPDPLVEALQRALGEAGYYSGPVDGIAGPRTEDAISAFERASGRLATGRPSPDVLALLQQPAAPEPPDRSGDSDVRQPAAAAEPSDPRIAAIQEALAKAAYGPLKADGVIGQQTRDAIMRFQRDHGLPVTGDVGDALILELRAAGALDE